MASGGIRHDFTVEDHLVRGEARTLRFTVENATAIQTTGTYTFYVLTELAAADFAGLAAAALVTVLNAAMTKTNPNLLDVPLATGNWPSEPGEYAFELWRDDSGNEARVSYGAFPVLP